MKNENVELTTPSSDVLSNILMRKLILLSVIIMLIPSMSLSANDKYLIYTQAFPWIGPDGEGPEVIFADLIEQERLVSVKQGEYIFYKDYCCRWVNTIGNIKNDREYIIKLYRDIIDNYRRHIVQAHPTINSTTIIIDINGSGDYTSIQDGIDNSVNGDTVLVYPGTYYENINYSGKDITVASLYITTQADSFIHQTIIDGNQNGSVVIFESGENTTAVLCGFTIQNGSGTIYQYEYLCGGGIFCNNSSPVIANSIIANNFSHWGGGIQCLSSNVTLINVSIHNNHANTIGGGLCLRNNSTIIFDSNNRCNIYLNYASVGSDICLIYCDEITEIVVDTFTVFNPDQDFVNTFYSTSVDCNILHAKITPINQDLYVSPSGNDNNSGLSEASPLKTISYALLKIASDSIYTHTVHLDEGIYSSSLTGERFPLNARSNVGIIGKSEEETILDGDSLYYLINYAFYDENIRLENVTIRHGYSEYGAGIKCTNNSNGVLKKVTIKDNYANDFGGGLYCGHNSNPIFEDVTIKNNGAGFVFGAIETSFDCNPVFINCNISNNYDQDLYTGCGGIGNIEPNTSPVDDTIIIINSLISKNSSVEIGGAFFGTCNVVIINSNFNDNNGQVGAVELSDGGNIEMVNSIMWDDVSPEIYFNQYERPSYADISYTDIKNGENGIQTNGNGTYNWGDGNISEDPLFVGGDPYSYELSKNSPCIDAGTPDTMGLHLPATDLAGNQRFYNGRIDIGAYEYQGIGIDEPDTSFIHNLYLFKNSPNPFKESTTISFISADYERIKEYRLSIYNTKGQLVRRYEGKKDDFWVRTEVVWDGTDEQGRQVAPGTYLYKLEYNGHAVVRKMIRLR